MLKQASKWRNTYCRGNEDIEYYWKRFKVLWFQITILYIDQWVIDFTMENGI